MKLLLVNCLNLSDGVRYLESATEQLGLVYIASALRREFSDQELEIQITYEPLTSSKLKQWKPDLVGLTAVSQNYHVAIEFARKSQSHDIPVIIGGVHISTLPHTLTKDMDVGVVFEGEETVVELMRAFMDRGRFNQDDLAKIRGIVFWDGDEQVRTELRPRIEDLDLIEPPARDLFFHPQRGILTGRGCPYDCAFCFSKPFWGKKARFHSAEYVVQELVDLVEQKHATKIIIYDDMFTAQKSRFEKIVKLAREAGLHRKAFFVANARPNEVTDELAEQLRSMNVNRVFLGIESGNQKTLEFLKKRACSVEQNYEAVRILRRHKIMTFGGMIIGSPQETRTEIMESYDFLKRSHIDGFSPLILTPLPGTDVWHMAKARGLVSDDMDWSVLRLEFDETPDRQIIMSEVLSRSELFELYGKFRQLQRRKYALLGVKHPFKAVRELAVIIKRQGHFERLRNRATRSVRGLEKVN